MYGTFGKIIILLLNKNIINSTDYATECPRLVNMIQSTFGQQQLHVNNTKTRILLLLLLL